MGNILHGRVIAGSLLNNEAVAQAITVDASGRLYLAPDAGGGLGYKVEFIEADTTAITRNPLPIAGVDGGGTIRSLRTARSADVGSGFSAANGSHVLANVGFMLRSSDAALVAMANAVSASGAAGHNILATGLMVRNDTGNAWRNAHSGEETLANTDVLAIVPMVRSTSTLYRPLPSISAIADGSTGLDIPPASLILFNGSTHDRGRTANAASGTVGTGLLGVGSLRLKDDLTYVIVKDGDAATFTTGGSPACLRVRDSSVGWTRAASARSNPDNTVGSDLPDTAVRVENTAGNFDSLKTATAASGTAGAGIAAVGLMLRDVGNNTWVNSLGDSTGNQRVTQYDGATKMNSLSTGADGSTNNLAGWINFGRPALFNETTWDRNRNNTEGTLLASAARTATTNTSDQTNYNARGVLISLDVSANPGGGETLSLDIQYKDPISGNYASLFPVTVVSTASNGTFSVELYPGAVETGAIAALFVQGLALPRTWRARVVHSAAGSWTYSLAFQTIL